MAHNLKSNRRRHNRMKLQAMYTSVEVQPADDTSHGTLNGHAYDISESGVRLELDQPLEIGQSVSLRLGLPGGENDICTGAAVVRVNKVQDDPGPRRMAMRFTKFQTPIDRMRLVNYLNADPQAMAA